MSRTDRTAGLDPETDFLEIYRDLVTYEFPWDMNQALSFALFRTYAVPSIGGLLDETQRFEREPQKRYDDTALLLEVPLAEGFDSPDGKAALRRINQMHHMYDISDDDMAYVLSTFVVVPKRWIDDFGWRRLRDVELQASVRYYQSLGRHLGIKQIPQSYAAFEALMDGYEREHFAFDAGSRRVADSTLRLLTSFYPRAVRRPVDVFSRALMDEPLLQAFGFDDPGPVARSVSRAALRARARVVALLPPRRHVRRVRDLPRIRSYPDGFRIEEMGTFTPRCPMAPEPHREVN